VPVTVDLTGVTAGGPAALEAGIYPAVIAKADVHDSKNSAEPTLYLDLSLSIEDEDTGETEERTMRWNTSLQPKQLGRFKELLNRLGFDYPEEGPFEFDEAELVGIECRVRLTQEPHYRDPERMTNRVAEILGTDVDEQEAWGG
jgi:hypothetical protein